MLFQLKEWMLTICNFSQEQRNVLAYLGNKDAGVYCFKQVVLPVPLCRLAYFSPFYLRSTSNWANAALLVNELIPPTPFP